MSVMGHTMFPYVDNSFIVAETEKDCVAAVDDLCTIFTQTGFLCTQDLVGSVTNHQIEIPGFLARHH